MGKKNRKAKSAAAETESGMPRHVRREVLEIASQLLEKCSSPFGSQNTEWNDFLDVYKLLERLRKKQQSYVLERGCREEHMPAFLNWLSDHGVDTSAVTVEQFGDAGYGLKAVHDIKESDLIISIPRTVMMTSSTAMASVLGGLIKEDRILQTMPNVTMALHLLCEYCSQDSFWMPYLKILPSEYTTPLYFTPEQLQLLKGSPALSEALNQFRNAARQYSYFFRLFQGHTDGAKLPIKNFCFDDYRWAVSTVMTRQNQIPGTETGQVDTALIPLWDMCNHTNGWITTDYNDDKDCSDCFALQHFNAGDQILIFYGPRSNAELLLHSGFVYDDNVHDRLAVRMGVSKNDQLFAMKAEVLARLPLSTNRFFYLSCDSDRPVDSELLAYLRVFSMDQQTLLRYLMGDGAATRQQQLKDFSQPVNVENETKSWSFLETRAQLLLKAYTSTVEEDDELLVKGDLGCHESLVVRLRRAEKKILHTVVSYSAAQKASAAARCEELAAELQNDEAEIAAGSRPFHITSVPTATGEQEFVRINDGTQVYGSAAERAASDAEFFESVRRGDYHQTSSCKPADGQDLSLESKVTSDLTSLDIRTSSEPGDTLSDCAVSAAETDDICDSTTDVDINAL